MQVIINVSIFPTWANSCILDLCSWSAGIYVGFHHITKPKNLCIIDWHHWIIYIADLGFSASIGLSSVGNLVFINHWSFNIMAFPQVQTITFVNNGYANSRLWVPASVSEAKLCAVHPKLQSVKAPKIPGISSVVNQMALITFAITKPPCSGHDASKQSHLANCKLSAISSETEATTACDLLAITVEWQAGRPAISSPSQIRRKPHLLKQLRTKVLHLLIFHLKQ